MDKFFHRFSDLFSQLGLSSDPVSIRQFIQTHSPLNASVRLEDAHFWSSAQAALLRDQLLEDSDWAEAVDQLNLALRGASLRE
jgi:Protein of unknown function (DUF2789)